MVKLGYSAYQLMQKLDYIRVAGTAEETNAADILWEETKAIGLKPKLEPFEIDGYTIHKAILKVTKPFIREIPVTGYGLSGSTPADGITAPFLYAENCNDIALSQSRGKIVLLNAHVTPYQYEKLSKAGVAGFITISGNVIDEREKSDLETRFLRADRHLKGGELGKIPGVTIRAIDVLEMMKHEPEEVTLILDQTEMKWNSRNVIAEIEGTDKNGEWLTIGAHYDSVPFSHGMFDNASGSAIIMEACKYFAVNRPRRSLRFIWFGAEERGLLGSQYHIKNNPDEIKLTKAMINVDLAGHVIGHHEFQITAQESVGAMLRFLAQEKGFGAVVQQGIYSSDSTAYADAGVPSFSFLRSGTVGHGRHDVIDYCSPNAMEKSAAFMLYFTERIVNSEFFPIPPEIPGDLKDKLDIYFGRKPPEDIQ